MKDSNAPKRPLSGYMRYSQSIRAQVQAETGLTGIHVAPHFSAAWKALSEEEREVYNGKAQKEMLRWKKKFAAYKKTRKYAEFQAKKKAKKLRSRKPKDKNAPKRPSSAYILFSTDVREDVKADLGDDATFATIASTISNMWNGLTEHEKAHYQRQNEKAKAKYAKTLAKYRTTRKFAQFQAAVTAFKQQLKEERKAEKAAKKAEAKGTKKIMKKKK